MSWTPCWGVRSAPSLSRACSPASASPPAARRLPPRSRPGSPQRPPGGWRRGPARPGPGWRWRTRGGPPKLARTASQSSARSEERTLSSSWWCDRWRYRTATPSAPASSTMAIPPTRLAEGIAADRCEDDDGGEDGVSTDDVTARAPPAEPVGQQQEEDAGPGPSHVTSVAKADTLDRAGEADGDGDGGEGLDPAPREHGGADERVGEGRHPPDQVVASVVSATATTTTTATSSQSRSSGPSASAARGSDQTVRTASRDMDRAYGSGRRRGSAERTVAPLPVRTIRSSRRACPGRDRRPGRAWPVVPKPARRRRRSQAGASPARPSPPAARGARGPRRRRTSSGAG